MMLLNSIMPLDSDGHRHLFLLKLFLVVILTIGLALIFVGAILTNLNRRTANWTAIDGKINNTSTIEINGDSGSVTSVNIEYSYIFNGCLHFSQRVRYGFSDANYDYTQLTHGEIIMVYVNPKNPNQSVLVTGSNMCDYIIIIFGLVVIIISSVSLASICKMRDTINEPTGQP